MILGRAVHSRAATGFAVRKRVQLLVLLALCPSAGHAAWPSNPAVNLAVTNAVNNQNIPAMIPDGGGGAFVVWTDGRSGGRDVYAGHVLSTGVNDPSWPLNGQSVCLATADQTNAIPVPDQSGGLLVAWQDLRNGSQDIYVQRITSSGLPSPGWPTNGLAVCTAADSQVTPVAISDGQGGAFIAWQDRRSVTSMDIYMHHVLANGTTDPAWPSLGLALCTATGRQERLRIIADLTGGAILTWSDQRAGIGADDIYAIRVQASGTIAPGWPANGFAVCAAAGEQSLPAIVSDGSGGALLAWSDERSGSTNADIYSQRILGTGSVAPGWTADGVAVCAAAGNQSNPSLAEDGSHGALVAWSDLRGGATSDVYAHRILSGGAPDPQWPVDGRALCSASNNQALPVSAADGFGGAIVTWTDFRAGPSNPDVYAQHVKLTGVLDDQWPADGAAISVATGSQASPKLIADGSGGAVVLWTDARNGATNADLYAQRVQASGALGGDVVGVPVEHASTLQLGPVEPNPVRGSAPTLAYGLPESGPARLELFDLTGRRISIWELSHDRAPHGRIQLDRIGSLRPGVYQLRLTQRAQTTTRRFVVL